MDQFNPNLLWEFKYVEQGTVCGQFMFYRQGWAIRNTAESATAVCLPVRNVGRPRPDRHLQKWQLARSTDVKISSKNQIFYDKVNFNIRNNKKSNSCLPFVIVTSTRSSVSYSGYLLF